MKRVTYIYTVVTQCNNLEQNLNPQDKTTVVHTVNKRNPFIKHCIIWNTMILMSNGVLFNTHILNGLSFLWKKITFSSIEYDPCMFHWDVKYFEGVIVCHKFSQKDLQHEKIEIQDFFLDRITKKKKKSLIKFFPFH